MLDLEPVQVSLLPQGAFSSYISQRQAQSVASDHVKPTHVNPTDKVLSELGAPRVVVEAVAVTEAERATAR